MKWNTKLRVVTGTVAGLVAACAFAAPAHAGILTKSATGCIDSPLTQPFAHYGDTAAYRSVGTFEDGAAGWALSGGAKAASGNETAHVSGAADSPSLPLPAGASATTPP